MNIEEHQLFEGDMFDLADKNKKQMSDEVRGYDKEYVLTADFKEVCTHLLDKYGLDVPVLSGSEPEVLEPVEVTIVRKRAWARDSRSHDKIYTNGTKIEYVLPFDGNPTLFEYRVGVSNHRPILGRVEGQELHLSYLLPLNFKDQHVAEMKKEFERDVELINKYLGWSSEEATRLNKDLVTLADLLLSQRKQNFSKVGDALTNLGLQVRRRENAPETYKSPVTRRELPVRTVGTAPKDTEPIPLSEEEYEHIIHVISNMGAVMERSPRAFVQMEEEDLRVHFLVQLNGQYEGQATGETFNLAGKTDILIRLDGQNIFIAECKYWTGPKGFSQAIDQLLGYLTWRDTKAAIVLFNKRKSATNVLRQIPGILESHGSFVSHVDYGRANSLRCVLKNLSDPEQTVLLTVILFNVPSPDQTS
jgi:hypothetical protein